ncbi:MAG: hypothetical protein RRB13_03925 [bacterium]|nr:hypothetical protein [bacterium]
MKTIVDFHQQYFWTLNTLHRKFVYDDIPAQAYNSILLATKLILLDKNFGPALTELQIAYEAIATDLLRYLRKRTDLAASSGLIPSNQKASYQRLVDHAKEFGLSAFADFPTCFSAFVEIIREYEEIESPCFLLHGHGKLSNALTTSSQRVSTYTGLAIPNECIDAAKRTLDEVMSNQYFSSLLKSHSLYTKDILRTPQPQNEVRNALTHIMRGFCGNQKLMDTEARRAAGHFNRAFLDYCKITAVMLDILQFTLESFQKFCKVNSFNIPLGVIAPDYDQQVDHYLEEYIAIYAGDHESSQKQSTLDQFHKYVISRYNLVFLPLQTFSKDPQLAKNLDTFINSDKAKNGRYALRVLVGTRPT